ncbi:MAG: OmpA family protein [Verrucomicrobiota bacterium]
MNSASALPYRAPMLLAAMASLLVHAIILFWWQFLKLDFGPPVIDPIQPKRFHLERAKIDPKLIERHPDLPSAQRHIELDPQKIAAFSGPLKTPSIPLPRIADVTPAPLGMGPSSVPVPAFSALPIETKGNVPQLAQALAEEASTQALKETARALQPTDLLGGGNAKDAVPGSSQAIPQFGDISTLLRAKPATMLARPVFQPILLRLSSDVLFKFDSDAVLPTAEPILDQVAQLIRDALHARVTIEGHTDTIGKEDYNQNLSERRAHAVSSWLETRLSVSEQTFAVRGFGETRPIVNPNGNPDEQARNRRVEIRIEAEK